MKKNDTGRQSRLSLTDWERIRNMQDEDIAFDEDSPRTTEADWEGAVIRKAGEVIGRYRGKGKRPAKESVTIRYTPAVLEAFRASGAGWQTRMDAALLDWLKNNSPEKLVG
jgi:uncharacterized protein (DUF4415 family)